MHSARNGDSFRRVGCLPSHFRYRLSRSNWSVYTVKKLFNTSIFLTVAKWIFVTFLCLNCGSYKYLIYSVESHAQNFVSNAVSKEPGIGYGW